MDFFPIFFDIKQKPCLVIGGGEVAARKVSLLLKAQAEVTVVSPELARELSDWHEEGKITHVFNRASIVQNIGNFFIGIGPIILGSIMLFLISWLS